MLIQKFCLLTPQEGDDLRAGVELNHRAHRHIEADQARLLVNGAERFPWLDEDRDAVKTGGVTQRHKPVAHYGYLPDGSESTKHVVLCCAFEWTMMGTGLQYLPQGTNRPRRRRTRVKIGRGYERASAAANNQRQLDASKIEKLLEGFKEKLEESVRQWVREEIAEWVAQERDNARHTEEAREAAEL